MAHRGHAPETEVPAGDYADETKMAGKKRMVHRSKRGVKRTRKRGSKRS
jgi:hypothetical protein